MKGNIIRFIFVFFLMLFLLPNFSMVNAKIIGVNCNYSLNQRTIDNWIFSNCSSYLMGRTNHEYLLYVDFDGLSIPSGSTAYIYTEGKWYDYEDGGYPKAEIQTIGGSEIFMFYPYNNVGDFIWKGALATNTGDLYVCNNTSTTLKLFSENHPQSSSFFGVEHTATYPTSQSYNIYSTNNELVGGAYYKTSAFTIDRPIDCDCGSQCGSFQLLKDPNVYTANIDYYIKKGFCESTWINHLTYVLNPPNCPDSSVKGVINYDDIGTLYTRPATVPIYTNPPPPPTVSIYGYVKDALTGTGIAGARVRIDVYNGSSYDIGTDTLTTDANGKWIEYYASDSPPSSIRLVEMPNTTAYCDYCPTGIDCTPQTVSGNWIIDDYTVGWSNPSGGPLIFYNHCTGPSPSPSPTILSVPSPSPTSVQNPWIKFKNSSFQSTSSDNVNNPVPVSVSPYDNDDDTSPFFITGNSFPGLTYSSSNFSITSSYNPSTKYSSLNWSATNPSPRLTYDKSTFESYVKSRKSYESITDLSQISDNKIFLLHPDTGNIEISDSDLNRIGKIVLIVDGNVYFDGDFNNPKDTSVAILADAIFFHKQDGSTITNTANGIFIADEIDTGTGDGLKIGGNLIAKKLVNERVQQDNNSKPSVFINFDVNDYLNLLPYLSVDRYEWKQLQ